MSFLSLNRGDVSCHPARRTKSNASSGTFWILTVRDWVSKLGRLGVGPSGRKPPRSQKPDPMGRRHYEKEGTAHVSLGAIRAAQMSLGGGLTQPEGVS